MWMEFVVGSLPYSEKFFAEYSSLPFSLKTNTSKFQTDYPSCSLKVKPNFIQK